VISKLPVILFYMVFLFLFGCSGETIESNNDSSSQSVVTSESQTVDTGTSTSVSDNGYMFLSSQKLTYLQNKYNSGDDTWVYFKRRVDGYLISASETSPGYGIGEVTAALALAYHITGDNVYRDKSKALFFAYFIDERGSWNYRSGNAFRVWSKWAFMTFNWLYSEWTVTEKQRSLDKFKEWGEYWGMHVTEENMATSIFRVVDSDHVTALAESFLLLGLVFKGEAVYSFVSDATASLHNTNIISSGTDTVPTSDIMLAKADWLMDDMVVAEYMDKWMKGGLWGEGTDYSPATMQHWMRHYMINKEMRGIAYPNAYYEDVMKATLHSTFPAFNGMFMYGDMEQIDSTGDYTAPSHEYRYDMMLHLIAMQTDATLRSLGQNWLNTVKQKEADAPPNQSAYSGIWRLLFEDAYSAGLTPQAVSENTTFIAEGLGFVASRSGWGEADSVLYFQNSKAYVDHEHASALSFDIIRGDTVISKESTGYLYTLNSPAYTSTAHNTLLIQNESLDGSNNPVGRAEGDGVNRIIASTADYTYIEADATKVYNRGEGYLPDVYADHVVRKLVFLKNMNTVVVYDSIGIKQMATSRWTKYIQHFQKEPQLANGVYSAANEGSRFFVKPLYPQDAVVTKVDESVAWNGFSTVEAPMTQRKWHLSISKPGNPKDVEYLNVLYFDDDTVTTMPATQLLHTDNLAVSTGNVAGSIISGASKDTVVMFNNDPTGVALSATVAYQINTSNQSSHLLFGLDSSSGYSINIVTSGAQKTVNITLGGVNFPSAEGVLTFDLDANGVLQ